MLSRDDLDALAAGLTDDPERLRLLARMQQRVEPLLQGRLTVPSRKALLSRDGGVCPDDGVSLRFDPLSPDRHRCPRCGREWTGERHDLHWARAQHLWLAERAADLALLAALDGVEGAADAANHLLRVYGDVYPGLPNRDNVLGPSHLFFSTYLESMWLTNALAAATVLREAELLAEQSEEQVSRIADLAAGLIGSFVEGMSNRQTWHAAALAAVAVWFGDDELAETAVEARTGLLGHLTDGFGEDGLWHEGENYHLFALRGLMLGLGWARMLDADLLEDPELREHFRVALLAPARTALPDLTHPARGDSRYGVSLVQPANLELWVMGRAWLGADPDLDAWLATLRAAPIPLPDHTDAWLHDAGLDPPARRSRGDLSWWTLTAPADKAEPDSTGGSAWAPGSRLFPAHGLAILRRNDRYASLEAGPARGGHGHPDRLHLTLHAGGVHWLPDPGTGSYVHPSLAWYRSSLAHNAPLVDGVNAGGADAACEAFDNREDWAWVRGKAGELRRMVVAGPTAILDVLELDSRTERRLELPWHFTGALRFVTPGRLEPVPEPLAGRQASRFSPGAEGPVRLEVLHDGARLPVLLRAPGAEILVGRSPGLPGQAGEREFLLLRGRGVAARWITVLDFAPPDSPQAVRDARAEGEMFRLETGAGEVRFRIEATGLAVERDGASVRLAGLRLPGRPVLAALAGGRGGATLPADRRFGWDAVAQVPRSVTHVALDGTLEGFDCSDTLSLEGEEHYRPSEEPFDPEEFGAVAWVNWDDEAVYVAVEVAKSDLVLRAADAPPLDLDNEADDIHADGLQVYLEHPDGAVAGFVVSLDPGGSVRGRSVEGTEADGSRVEGAWQRTESGYRVTFRIRDDRLAGLQQGAQLGFDLIVNEMRPGRRRRAGQLVWSGGDGWVYLRGDRQDRSHFGRLVLG